MAEVAGVALAVVPLVASAAMNFCKVYDIFVRFRNYGPEVKEFQTLLMLQRTIFRNECQLLIARVTSQENASDMLANALHPLWEDQSFSEKLSIYLGMLKEAWIRNIAMVGEKLKAIETEGQELAQIVLDSENSRSAAELSRRRRFAKKMKFAFSESSLDHNLHKIQELNTSLRWITDQVSRHHELRQMQELNASIRQTTDRLLQLPGRRADNEKLIGNGTDEIARSTTEDTGKLCAKEQRKSIEKIRLVQKVSAHLYNALCSACSVHSDHAAHISLDPILAEGEDSQVRFSVSFCPLKSLTINGTARPGDPVWFAIESIVKTSFSTGTSCLDLSLPSMEQSRKRKITSNLKNCYLDPKRLKTVRWADSHDTAVTIAVRAAQALSRTLSPNFCTRIKNCSQHLDTPKACLGCLDENSDFEHKVYLPSQPSPDQQKHIRSLEQVFRFKSSSVGSISLYEKFRCSRLLATALLQFYATPWLASTWRSRNIFVFNSLATAGKIEDADDRLDLASLYTNVPVRGAHNSSLQSPNGSSPTFAPNTVLFNLGVIMMEIAFEEPIQGMRKSLDFDQCMDDRHTDFFTARRLSDTLLVNTQMGPRFGEIVRKCIHCDFGRGRDLNKPELQEGVYREVVCELSDLETKFRELQLGS